ncbi:MAG: PspC domain-containing protein [Alistipes sp.]|nr:PspC domain-containing protein [Alistipes sp.]
MKETINVNIGGQAFTLDKDAYQRLDDYLTDVRSRLNDPTGEVMSDIEGGIADIFSQALSSQVMVVTLQMVEAAIRRMGNPDDFGPAKAEPKGATKVNPSSQLRRSRTDRSIAGVCGGIAAYFKLEPSLVRLVMLLLFLFGGLSLWVYVILWLLIPEEE